MKNNNKKVENVIWNNRKRQPQSNITLISSYKDSKGVSYSRFSNGMIMKDLVQ
jgi:hypothetical protein